MAESPPPLPPNGQASTSHDHVEGAPHSRRRRPHRPATSLAPADSSTPTLDALAATSEIASSAVVPSELERWIENHLQDALDASRRDPLTFQPLPLTLDV